MDTKRFQLIATLAVLLTLLAGSLSIANSKALQTTAAFAQVFAYPGDAAVFQLNGPDGSVINSAIPDFYNADGLAMMRMPDGRYIYAWRKPDGDPPDVHSNIEFTLLNADGSVSLPITQVTNNAGLGQTYDYAPSVATIPSGNIGITWYRLIMDSDTGQSNYNMYFAVLSSSGTLLSGPINLTNNNLWDNFNNYSVPHFFNPTIAATDDNRFILSWRDKRTDGGSIVDDNIWYAVFDANGASTFASTALTSDGNSYLSTLNSLKDHRAILTWTSDRAVMYAVIDSSGAVNKLAAVPGGLTYESTDAVQLPNGNVVVAWPAAGQGVAFVILDSIYDIANGPNYATNPDEPYNTSISVTYDSASHIIMTWAEAENYPTHSIYYALADDSGTFITQPVLLANAYGLIVSENGQGNAPIISALQTLQISIDIKPGSPTNPITLRSQGTVPVAILSTPDFDAPSMVDEASLTFGKTGDESSLAFCNENDVNGDGLPDLSCHFYATMTGFQLGDARGVLKGKTLHGDPIEGSDSITILK